ncbi:phosphoglucosamine mutase [Botrimarina hoheduenensis]|uniref:Phosphoglucosamine mutase n=1 Tax=Botrimarina hoheduenensis TaxID=2528000 RepID=A0A5C5WAF5_9BACT|nr:phosphoglucosamine mutase [Botrimarina hoheduenensis]TWT47293.1 Phosphoglucosamine mutase [Botrimarina hoheduenensis]
MDQPIISVSGLRGVIGQTLTPEIATRYVAAFAAMLPRGKVLVTRDGRSTGPMIAQAARAGISAAGRDVLDADVAATPTAGVLVQSEGCVGGVQISASHNPAEYNGLKLFGEDGRIIPGPAGQEVKDRYLSGQIAYADHANLGAFHVLTDSLSEHLRRVEAIVDTERIRSHGFRVLLDSNHGSGCVLGRKLLERLGCDVCVLGCSADGQFAHPPEPTEGNLADVAHQAIEGGYDAIFCQDPDADRLAIIDGEGRYLGEELTLALCVDHQLRKRPGPIVSNCSSSRVTRDLAERYNVPFTQSAVGEANVVDAMLRSGAVLGGEGAGGVIHPEVVLVRDSFVGMAMVLDAMAARSLPLAELADELPQYAIHKTKATLAPERLEATLSKLQKQFAGAEVDRLDGLRLDWPHEKKWLLVRASNTEPIVRLIAEAPERDAAVAVCEAASAVIAAS